jgi:predicted Zn-dependent protease
MSLWKSRLAAVLAALLLSGTGALVAAELQSAPAPRVERVGSAASLAPTARVTRSAARAAASRARSAARANRGAAVMPVYAERTASEVRERIAQAGGGTYIDEMLLERDSSLARWPDRTARPLRVWVQSASALEGWRPQFADEVRRAFATWQAVGVPVHFTFVADSAGADVHVAWIDHFPEPISGRTLWARDDRWWIVGADLTVALRHAAPNDSTGRGAALDDDAVRAIALHEVGHLLGLDHTADASNIMTPRVRSRALSAADVATVRLLYSLPPGSVR